MASMKRRKGGGGQTSDAGDAAAGQGAGDADSARRGLVSVNGLTYTLPPDLSVVTERSNKNSFFAQNVYKDGQNMTCICNTGAQYILGRRSYLELDLKNIDSTNAICFGVGSLMNIFRDITITTRSGDDAERVFEANRYCTIKERMQNSTDWVKTVGKMLGMTTNQRMMSYRNQSNANATGDEIFTDNRIDQQPQSQLSQDFDTLSPQDQRINGVDYPCVIGAGKTRRFCIPLSCLSGLFSFDKLLPPMLMSGLRIDFRLETGTHALVSATNAPAAPAVPALTLAYEIHNPHITFDSYKLTDAIERVLNEESALRGLEIPFTSVYTTTTGFKGTGGSRQNIECRKAVSRALSIGVVQEFIRESNDGFFDNFQTLPFDFTEWQVRIGSLYLPQQKIVGTVGENFMATYHHSLRAIGKLLSANPSSMDLESWTGSINADTAQTSNTNDFTKILFTQPLYQDARVYSQADVLAKTKAMCMVNIDLERSNVQRLSGIPINNSRVAQWTAAAGECPRTVYIFLKRVRLLRVFLQNVEVEE